MNDELRWVLIIIGALLIGGVLLHGLWSIRKGDKDKLATTPSVQQEPVAATPVVNETRDEPDMGNISVSIDDDERRVEPEQDHTEQSPKAVEPQDYIIVHIQTEEGIPMQGSVLLPLVLTLGFKYSEDGFFNRHEDTAGNGAVLFRLVNMFNPGTFDIDNMEQFKTEGVSLFMTLPCEGEALPAFNMLHSAAKKIADEFGAQILDHERQPLDVAQVRQYVEKIREFESA